MSANRKAIIFSIGLIIVSLSSMSIRYLLNDPEDIPAGDSVWELHWEFQLSDSIRDAAIRLAAPMDTPYIQVFEQNISLEGMRIRRSRLSKDGTREIIAHATRGNDVSIGVDFAMRVSPLGIPHYIKQRDILDSTRRQLYISPEEQLPVNEEIIQELLNSLVGEVSDQTLMFNALFEYCMSKIKTTPQGSDNVLSILQNKKASVLGKVRLLTALSRAAKIPARIVMGVILDEESDILQHYWIEINTNGKWLSFDPSEGFIQEMPANYLPIRKNGESIIVFPAPMQLKLMILEANKRDVVSDFFTESEENLNDILDLNRLSLSTRLTLSFLLLLPLGALITVFIRQVIGPNVYGTFTPTFLALALLHVGWLTGGIIICIVTAIGIIGRSFTPSLELNRVSRLTIVFILVSISMIFSISLMVHYGLVADGSIVLLPIVILTFMIDRIYKLADSDGVKVALIRLAWTLFVSVIVAAILQMDMLGLWILSNPEFHLITAAFVIIISQYKGLKWMQKIGLRWMLEPEKDKNTGKNTINEKVMAPELESVK